MKLRGLAALGWLLAVAGPGAAVAQRIEMASTAIADARFARPAPEPLTGVLSLPGTAGPYPVIILLHGCNGLGNGSAMNHWVERVKGWGYGAFVLDSFTPRHVRNVCAPADQPKVTVVDRAGDVVNAAWALSQTAGVDGRRIGVIGFSHGGGTAAVVARRPFVQAHPGLVRAAVDYYGGCRVPELYGGLPLLALNGTSDDWGNPASTCAAFALAVAGRGAIENHSYDGVVHGFDNPDLVRMRVAFGHRLQFDAVAAADSYERTRAFLDRFVRDAR